MSLSSNITTSVCNDDPSLCSQLVVKHVVDSSLRHGQPLDSESQPLHQLLVVLDLVFRHGLKTRKGLLLGRRDVWDLVQTVEKCDRASEEIINTVRNLTSINTSLGRVRAWIRLAIMQKKFADYLKFLVDNRPALLDFYETDALLCSEEAALVCGLLVSLNIVDCNLFVKEEEFDNQEGIIDLTQYLRRKEDIGRDDCVEDVGYQDLITIMEQKSYIEEINRNLAANVLNLQSRVDSLTSDNAILREDVAISNKKVSSLEEENVSLTEQLEKKGKESARPEPSPVVTKVKHEVDPSKEDEFEYRLEEFKSKNTELGKELMLEVQIKAEMEMAMKLLEKDVHEKQDTIISLRSQLEDIKNVNLEMFNKLSQCEKSLTYKSEMIQKLEQKTTAMAETMQQLDSKFSESEKKYRASKAENDSLTGTISESSKKISELSADLSIERDWRTRLQENSITDRDTISELQQDNEFLKQVSGDYENMRQDNDRLKEQVREGETTLEELGQQLSWSKLQLSTLKDETSVSGVWLEDSQVSSCKICQADFGLSRRKHHCRNCGNIFCSSCSDNKMKLASAAKPMR